MKHFLEKISPVGFNYRKELTKFALILGVPLFIEFLMFFGELTEAARQVRSAGSGALMPPLGSIIPRSFTTFVLWYCLIYGCVLSFALWRSHYTESNSAYTMRRLPNRWEYALRIAGLPILEMVIGIIGSAVLLAICTGLYYVMTPA